MDNKLIDHLFRHQFGKMVSILTRIFGLTNLELIEDAVQDTFETAMIKWRTKIPPNPEAWLTQAAKNRAIDLIRKIKADHDRIGKLSSNPSSLILNDLFLDSEIEDSQLRMIFTCCHASLNPKDQIAFALRSISGFSTKEIASALLLKNETVKKRLSRARSMIVEQNIEFIIPTGKELSQRLSRVLECIYLIFNEGFHSGNPNVLIRQDLCFEAMRLIQMILKKPKLRLAECYALLALICFHAARLKSKMAKDGSIIDLKNQDRQLWDQKLIMLGNQAMHHATLEEKFSIYHFEAAIASEHLMAKDFNSTNWNNIIMWYENIYKLNPSPMIQLSIAMVKLQMGNYSEAKTILDFINPDKLEQRAYLYYGTYAEYHVKLGNSKHATGFLENAISKVNNQREKEYLTKKLKRIKNLSK